MDQQTAIKIVIDVALKRLPHARTTLATAVQVLESTESETKPKKPAVKK